MTRSRIVCVVTCLAAGVLFSENSVFAGARKDLPNEVSLELGGKCLLYSFSYQRMLVEPFGLEVGVSMLGGASSGSSTSILFFTGGGKFYITQGNAAPYVGGGMVVISASTTTGPFTSSGSGSYGYAGPGFEYRFEGGFLLRGSVYALIGSGGFFVWPGASVGIAF